MPQLRTEEGNDPEYVANQGNRYEYAFYHLAYHNPPLSSLLSFSLPRPALLALLPLLMRLLMCVLQLLRLQDKFVFGAEGSRVPRSQSYRVRGNYYVLPVHCFPSHMATSI